MRSGLGKTLLIIAAMVASMAAVRAITAIQALVSLVFTNVVSTISAVFGMFLAMARGADLILKYYAAKALVKALKLRATLALNLQIDINSLITTLNSITAVETLLNGAGTLQAKRALIHVKRARLIINREISIMERHTAPAAAEYEVNLSTGYVANTPIPRKAETIKQALDEVDSALLTLGVNTQDPATKSALSSLKAEGETIVNNVINDPAVNSTIKAYLLLTVIRTHVDNISYHTPVVYSAAISKGVEKVTGKSIGSMLTIEENDSGFFSKPQPTGNYSGTKLF